MRKASIAIFFFIITLFVCIDAEATSIPLQKIVRQGDNIYISFRYKGKSDFHLLLGRCGVNNIFNFKRIYLDKASDSSVSPWVSPKALIFMKSKTDWVGPYVIRSMDPNDIGNRIFTGGWHGSNGDATGDPTGRTESIKAQSGGIELQDNKVYSGDVKITVVNYLKGYNTLASKKEILKEMIVYNVVSGKVNIDYTATALSDLEILLYYGPQAQGDSYTGKVIYGNGKSFSSNGIKSDSGNIGKDNKVNNYTLISKTGQHTLRVTLDSNVGLGNFSQVIDTKPSIFTENYDKTYFNLINGDNKQLKTGESIKWSASYEFS